LGRCEIFSKGFPNVTTWSKEYSPRTKVIRNAYLRKGNGVDLSDIIGAQKELTFYPAGTVVLVGDQRREYSDAHREMFDYRFFPPLDATGCILFYADFIHEFISTLDTGKLGAFNNRVDNTRTLYVSSDLLKLINADVISNFSKTWRLGITSELCTSLQRATCKVPNATGWFGGNHRYSCGSLSVDSDSNVATMPGLTVLGNNSFWGLSVKLVRVDVNRLASASGKSHESIEDVLDSKSTSRSSTLSKMLAYNRSLGRKNNKKENQGINISP